MTEQTPGPVGTTDQRPPEVLTAEPGRPDEPTGFQPLGPGDDADRIWRARRQRRQTRTFLALLTAVLMTGVVGYTYWVGLWSLPGGERSARVDCPTAVSELVPIDEIQLHVYNASSKHGLAGATARKLQARGFVVSEIGNDPLGSKVKGPALIRYGPDGIEPAKTVEMYVKGKVRLVADDREDESVDLVLGSTWSGIKAAKDIPALGVAQVPAGCPQPTASLP